MKIPDLDAIEKLCKAASPYQCVVHDMGTDAGGNRAWGVYTPLDFRLLARCPGSQAEANARLFAKAHHDELALIAHTRELRGFVGQVLEAMKSGKPYWHGQSLRERAEELLREP